MQLPFKAPTLTATIAAGASTPASNSAWSTPTWAAPRAPPPPSTHVRRAGPKMASVPASRSAAYFAASAAEAKEPTSTRGSAYLLGTPHRRVGLLTERAQEATPASAPPGVPAKSQISWGGLAPGRLGREDARNFRDWTLNLESGGDRCRPPRSPPPRPVPLPPRLSSSPPAAPAR